MPTSKYSVFSRRNIKGFTLIEIVVVMGIMAILSSMMLGYSQRNSRQVLLATTQAKLGSLFARAKALSLQSFFYSGPQDENICGHGVYVDIDNQEVFIFQDIVDDGPCPKDIRQYEYSSSEDKKLTGELNQLDLKNKTVSLESVGSPYVIFVPPEPRVKFDDNNTNESTLTITNGDANLSVIITKDGQIRRE